MPVVLPRLAGRSMPPGNLLRRDEDEWRELFERLQERFPTVAPERVLQALRTHDGHAGNAAAELRSVTSITVKAPDPDDAEHVSTLLSSPMIFKHACSDHFRKYDVNGDGVLDLTEILSLTNDLYNSFGLSQPSEGCLRAFFQATDRNADGVLNEDEFRQFFEMFLRYAFFDVVRLQQLVDRGADKLGDAQGEASGGSVRKRHSECADGYVAAAAAPGAEEVSRQPPRERERDRERHERGSREASLVRHSSSHRGGGGEAGYQESNRQREERDAGYNARRDLPVADVQPGSLTAYCCVNPNGVTYRRGPVYDDRMDHGVAHGETVQVLEQWIRTPHGWLPMINHHGNVLFDRVQPPRAARARGEGRSKSSAAAQARGQVAPEGAGPVVQPAAKVASEPVNDQENRPVAAHEQHENRRHNRGDDGPSHIRKTKGASRREVKDLKESSDTIPDEWQAPMKTLMERFPSAGAQRVLQALREHGGHAGKAASQLRDSGVLA
eukprot:TRINITY_DN112109_c0_g1_i1.p1 TRINITY_DN112109_c0_g1~~TRINITY_DN112109_c0_g1_i1.p1  ORF type:complete len:497 (-),score=103.99 TRINITY_DN112109_c0_g1_i1:209-1699(-)